MEGKENIVITDKVFEEYKTNHFNRQRDLKINFFLVFRIYDVVCNGIISSMAREHG